MMQPYSLFIQVCCDCKTLTVEVLATSNNGWPKLTTAPVITSGLITTARIQVTRVTSGRGIFTTGTGALTTGINEDETSDATSKFVVLMLSVLLLFI